MNSHSSISYDPIGIIHSPLKNRSDAPIQPSAKPNIVGKIEIFPKFTPCLKDLNQFSFIFLFYHFNRITKHNLQVKPYLDTEIRGVFSTRAPSRPNTIGFSLVELVGIDDNIISVKHVDMLDQTPLLDIKPFVPPFDCALVKNKEIKIGWLSNKIQSHKNVTDDGRFQ
ncbi:hypothetical protein NEF87_003121 [Candidatus Lokiarchaeum ossiferum]|uniref:TsaA-like domain-containing protein n=1 Tax=Candidatus Lokiarchaeum ossiferum TaxID=2951803 RepID=A0ABY6HTT9_9ARCH|nr:hypothetical protein NEF87_003121 [Candidatus Lokiarchaeum sp. B-35]